MKVLFFSSLTEITGCAGLEITGVQTVGDLRQWLQASYPGIESVQFAIAVNRVVVQDNRQLSESDEIALLPPFSGG